MDANTIVQKNFIRWYEVANQNFMIVDPDVLTRDIDAALAAARQEEREVCAKIAGLSLYDSHPDYYVCVQIAAAIRARTT